MTRRPKGKGEFYNIPTNDAGKIEQAFREGTLAVGYYGVTIELLGENQYRIHGEAEVYTTIEDACTAIRTKG